MLIVVSARWIHPVASCNNRWQNTTPALVRPDAAHLRLGPRPNAPINVSVWQNNEGLHITWQAPTYSPVPVHEYLIEYKTVGPWVSLDEPQSADKSGFTWKTVSRGATYHFRLLSSSSAGVRSLPTGVVSFTTTGNSFFPLIHLSPRSNCDGY